MKTRLTVSCVMLLSSAFLLLSSQSTAQRTQVGSSLDDQALIQAKRFFNRMFAKCGEYYYYKYKRDMWFLYQCKSAPVVSIRGKTNQPRQLSAADRLNGVDPLPVAWEGDALIHWNLCRNQAYYQDQEPGFSAWGQWSDTYEDFVPFTDKKGQWEFANGPTGKEFWTVTTIVPITCEDIPSATKRASPRPPYWAGESSPGAYDLKIPATFDHWFSLGRGPMVVALPGSFSQIFIDGTKVSWTPLGQSSEGKEVVLGASALAPGLDLGAIVLKIGKTGQPFQPFSTHGGDGGRIKSNEEVFIAINDSDYTDNRGEHAVIVEGATMFERSTSVNNIALGKAVSITTNGADDASDRGSNCNDPAEVTDGWLLRQSDNCASDGIVGFQNHDYGQLMEVTVTIDLGKTYRINGIRYNPGNVQRAETWNADLMISPFGRSPTNPGRSKRGAWTEHTGTLTASTVKISFQKTRRAYADDWLYIGEIEVIGSPVIPGRQ